MANGLMQFQVGDAIEIEMYISSSANIQAVRGTFVDQDHPNDQYRTFETEAFVERTTDPRQFLATFTIRVERTSPEGIYRLVDLWADTVGGRTDVPLTQWPTVRFEIVPEREGYLLSEKADIRRG